MHRQSDSHSSITKKPEAGFCVASFLGGLSHECECETSRGPKKISTTGSQWISSTGSLSFLSTKKGMYYKHERISQDALNRPDSTEAAEKDPNSEEISQSRIAWEIGNQPIRRVRISAIVIAHLRAQISRYPGPTTPILIPNSQSLFPKPGLIFMSPLLISSRLADALEAMLWFHARVHTALRSNKPPSRSGPTWRRHAVDPS